MKGTIKSFKEGGNISDFRCKRIEPNGKVIFPIYGSNGKGVIKAIKELSDNDIRKFEKDGTFDIQVNGEAITLKLSEVEITNIKR